MNKLLSREFDFVFDPSYSKINKKIDLVVKELSGIFGSQYRNVFKERIGKANFIFYNRITDLDKYIKVNEEFFNDDCDKKILSMYKSSMKKISEFNDSIESLKNKLRSKFISEVSEFLNYDDQSYLKNHRKIDYSRLCCYPIFFNDNSSKLIDGLLNYFSDEVEAKYRDPKTDVLELERIVNNREMCLKLLGLRNVNLNSFDISSISKLFETVDKYNNIFAEEFNQLNLDKDYIIDNYLISNKLLSHIKDGESKKNLEYILSNDMDYVESINNDIMNYLYIINESMNLYVDDKYSGERFKFVLFSPCMNYENLDYLFVRSICRVALEPVLNNENEDATFFGNDKYFYYNNLLIDYVSYMIMENINNRGSKIICSNMNLNVSGINDGLFLMADFYELYKDTIFVSTIEDNKWYFYNLVGERNFENFIDIVNKYYYDVNDKISSNKSRRIFSNVEMIKNILRISLSNMEQYKKILLDKDRYDHINNM